VNPTHLIVCNKQGTGSPGVQRIRLADGLVGTILTGTSSCDPAHRTPGQGDRGRGSRLASPPPSRDGTCIGPRA